jgi:hypothetical protein
MPVLSSAYIGSWYNLFDRTSGKAYLAKDWSETQKMDASNTPMLAGDIGMHVANIGGITWETKISSPVVVLAPTGIHGGFPNIGNTYYLLLWAAYQTRLPLGNALATEPNSYLWAKPEEEGQEAPPNGDPEGGNPQNLNNVQASNTSASNANFDDNYRKDGSLYPATNINEAGGWSRFLLQSGTINFGADGVTTEINLISDIQGPLAPVASFVSRDTLDYTPNFYGRTARFYDTLLFLGGYFLGSVISGNININFTINPQYFINVCQDQKPMMAVTDVSITGSLVSAWNPLLYNPFAPFAPSEYNFYENAENVWVSAQDPGAMNAPKGPIALFVASEVEQTATNLRGFPLVLDSPYLKTSVSKKINPGSITQVTTSFTLYSTKPEDLFGDWWGTIGSQDFISMMTSSEDEITKRSKYFRNE